MNRLQHKISGQRRLLGDARRETTAAVHLAASKRRRLAQSDEVDEQEDDSNPTDTRALDDNDVAIFAGAAYEPDDVEADNVYAQVQERMESRRKKQREENLQAELKKYREANPTLRQQFVEAKTNLSGVTADEWASIPEIGDYSIKKEKLNKFTPVPDSLLERARQETAYVASEPAGGAATDLASIGAGRSSLLGQKLDIANDTMPAQTSVNVDNYLNKLSGVKVTSESEIGDIKKARLLLRSVTQTNPKHAPGWIAAARLEETAGRISDARSLILEGCSSCPREEDVWVEAARLHPPATGKRLLAKAVRMVPRSPNIWLQAAALEVDKKSKKRVLRKALEIVPNDANLWKAAVDLEEPIGARILLSRAVECVPSATDLWLALARLESYERAKDVLREARIAVPQEPAMWITAAQLEEAQHGAESVEIYNLIQQGIKSLSINSHDVSRERWIAEAVKSDQAGYKGSVRAIVTNSIGLEVEENERVGRWVSDAKSLESKGCLTATRSIYEHLTKVFPTQEDLWISFADFEKRRGDIEGAQGVLLKAVDNCPRAVTLWLMLAKDKWKNGSASAAREVLREAFEANPESEDVWLAAAKVEAEGGQFERARSLLAKAMREAPSARVYMKSALLERFVGEREAERKLLQTGVRKYEKGEKMWLMLAQWHERGPQENGDVKMHAVDEVELNGDTESGDWVQKLKTARQVYMKGTEKCRKSVYLWIGYARLEEGYGNTAKARAILERGRERCRGSEEMDMLWRESVFLEVRCGKNDAARNLLARGLQECRNSGRLWALTIVLEGKEGQRMKSVEAMKQCGQDAFVLIEVGRYIWRSGKVDKAKTWLRKAVDGDPDIGDAWGALLAVVKDSGSDTEVAEVERDAVKAEPSHGNAWVAVSKKLGHERWETLRILRRVAEMMGKEPNVTGVY